MKNAIPADSTSVSLLKVLLADTYTLYLKTQNYHWNVISAQFFALHKMFEEQYEALGEAVDEIAERIRALNAKSPGSFAEFSVLKTLSEANPSAIDKEMILDLHESHQLMVKHLSNMIEQTGGENDLVTQDFLIGRKAYHEKIVWMLDSHI